MKVNWQRRAVKKHICSMHDIGTSCHDNGTVCARACGCVFVCVNVDYVDVIAVTVLQAVAELRKSGLDMNFSFLNYAQSSECRNWQDSSVSYAAGALIVH